MKEENELVSMNTTKYPIGKIILSIFISILLLGNMYFMWWIYKLEKPKPGTCGNSSFKWNEGCTSILEIQKDNTLPSPKGQKLNLLNFLNSPGAGNSIFKKCWYRFRYVNVLTGGYSDFSDWTDGPVESGGCNMPCIDGKCAFATGPQSCSFNQPTIGIASDDAKFSPQIPRSDGSFVYMNLHRYTTINDDIPSDAVTDEIVGVLIAPFGFKNNKGWWSWIDVLNNPCKLASSGCKQPNTCKGSVCP